MEIVNHPRLIFQNDSDAVEKIDSVLASDARQEELRTHLLDGTQRFSATAFMGLMRRVVAEYLQKQ